MSQRFPVLDEDKRLHFFSLANYVEALVAITSEQWLMAAPKVQLRLRQEVTIQVCYAAERLEVGAVAEPNYWRGQFVAMRVRAASPADAQKARKMLQQLMGRPDVAAAFAPTQGGKVAGGKGDGERPVGDNAATDPGLAETPTSPEATPVPQSDEALPRSDKPLPSAAVSLAVKVPDAIPVPPPDAAQPGGGPEKLADDGTWEIPPAPSAEASESTAERLSSWAAGASEESVELPILPEDSRPQEVPAQAPVSGAARVSSAAPVSATAAVSTAAPVSASTAVSTAASVSGSPAAPKPVSEAGPAGPSGQAVFGQALAGLTAESLMSQFPARGRGFPVGEGVTLYRVVAGLAANEMSGELEIEVDGKAGRLFLKSGTLLGVEPYGASFDEHFAKHLVTNRLAEEEPIRKAAADAQAHEKPLALTLYENRAVGLDVMGRELKKVKEELFFALLVPPKEGAARYRFHPRPRFGRKFDPVRLHLIGALGNVVRRVLAHKYAMDLDPLLEQFRFKYGVMKNNELIPIELLNPNEKEKHGVKYVFNGPNRLHESYGLCLLTRHGTARWVTMLHHFDLIEWKDEPVAVAGGETVEEVLDREWRSMEGQDHFSRLDIHWGAHPSKYDKALDRILKKYGPEGALAGNSEQAADLCSRIIVLAKESHVYLKDRKQRRAYRLELQGEQRVRRAAEFLVKQAELHRFRSDWDMAFELIEAAIDMHEHPAFVAKAQQWRHEKGGR